jgi:hypothetical protein
MPLPHFYAGFGGSSAHRSSLHVHQRRAPAPATPGGVHLAPYLAIAPVLLSTHFMVAACSPPRSPRSPRSTPVTPVTPVNPGHPGQPRSTPVTPVNPGQPRSTPVNPVTPVTPVTPVNPGQPRSTRSRRPCSHTFLLSSFQICFILIGGLLRIVHGCCVHLRLFIRRRSKLLAVTVTRLLHHRRHG